MEQQAIAVALHLDHVAALLDSRANASRLKLESNWFGRSLDMPQDVVKQMLERLLARPKTEWENFMAFLGPESFLASWLHEA